MPISEIRKELEVIIRGDDVENVEGYMEAQCSWREFSCVFICDCSISSDIILFNYKEKYCTKAGCYCLWNRNNFVDTGVDF